MSQNCLHLAVGRPLSLKYTKLWVLGGYGLGTGIVLPQPTRHPTTPGTPLPPVMASRRVAAPRHQYNSAVGLKSVGQLTLDV